LNRNGAGPLAWREAVAVAPPYYDVVADNLLEANDALAVIDYINERIAQNALEDAAHAEGESPADDDMLLAMTLTPSTRRRA